MSPRLSPIAPQWHITALWHVPPCPLHLDTPTLLWPTHPAQAGLEGEDGTQGLTPPLWASAHCHKATMSPKPPHPQHRGSDAVPGSAPCWGIIKIKN